MSRKIDISHKTIIFVTIFLLSLWIVYHILDLLLLLFVALIFMSALSPLISFLQKLKIPKVLGVLIIYLLFLGAIGGLLTVSFTPLIEETTKLALTLPSALADLLKVNNLDPNVIQSEVSNLSKNLFSTTRAIFDNIITIIFLLVLTFYLLLERENLEKRAAFLFTGQEDRIQKLLMEIEGKLGAWLRGQLFLSLIIGVLVYLGLSVLQIPYALSLSILAAFTEVIPVIGPIISAIPAILLALTISPVLAAVVTAMYFVIQQLENHLVVPQVMKKAVGLNPLVVILAIAVGGRLLGIGGALLAVPIVVVLQIIVLDILREKNA
ncbi:AI-2E family transporter [Candidatus Daviesbacteria bacterium]|nr:AI-2E family transporter [Candidatus Daviesbacteria bacterium]